MQYLILLGLLWHSGREEVKKKFDLQKEIKKEITRIKKGGKEKKKKKFTDV